MKIMKIISGIFLRIIVFGIFAYGSAFMQKNGITYHKGFYIIAIYNFAVSLICIFLFREDLKLLVQRLDNTRVVILAGALIAFFILGNLVNQLSIPQYIVDKYPSTFIFNFDNRYMVAKISDVLFQQVFVLSIIGLLIRENANARQQIAIFTILFVVLHFTMLLLAGDFAFFHIVLSIGASVVFAILIISFDYGFLYAFLFHVLGYLIFRLIVWVYYMKI